MSIYAHRPQRHQVIKCLDINFNPTHPSTTTISGCMLLFFDEERINQAKRALESANIPMESFISQALETYLYAAENVYPDDLEPNDFPQLPETLQTNPPQLPGSN